jgi:O-antigen chain-terminating methyltransferase
MPMLQRWTGKIAQVLWLLRYGSTQLQELRERQGQIGAQAAATEERLAQWHTALAELTQAVTAKAADADLQFVRNALAADIQRETGWLRDRLTSLAGALDAGMQARAPQDAAPVPPASVSAALDAFYPALENQFRGTQDEIRQRLLAYRPWLEGLPVGPMGDLGCGRGEWLELLREWGHAPVGVDLNPLHVEQNRAKGLDAVCADALKWLQAQPDCSLAALTSFHVVEHLPFGVLLQLVDQARRVLMPGGRLILETPNPENLDVATQSFWLDPTHLRPLPPVLLEFVATHAGLPVQATLRLNPPAGGGAEIADATLRGLLMQGRDYAVIARKPSAAA